MRPPLCLTGSRADLATFPFLDKSARTRLKLEASGREPHRVSAGNLFASADELGRSKGTGELTSRCQNRRDKQYAISSAIMGGMLLRNVTRSVALTALWLSSLNIAEEQPRLRYAVIYTDTE